MNREPTIYRGSSVEIRRMGLSVKCCFVVFSVQIGHLIGLVPPDESTPNLNIWWSYGKNSRYSMRIH